MMRKKLKFLKILILGLEKNKKCTLEKCKIEKCRCKWEMMKWEE
jgi:hypothetical protein